LQAYLKDCEADLRDIITWARARKRRITIRLVKGAYWDYETVLAGQKGWPLPVFSRKAQTDVNFETLSVCLLENDDVVAGAFGTHNVRSIAHVLAHAQQLDVPPRNFEFQMLYGMADAIKSALLLMDLRVREYTPVGELLPGMAYLVRRLLENTSNEGFLANTFAKGAHRDELLRNPAELLEKPGFDPTSIPAPETKQNSEPRPARSCFVNEPPVDFTIGTERERLRAALATVRATPGRKHPLLINHKPVQTREWTPSLNPANQNEIIGYAARATAPDRPIRRDHRHAGSHAGIRGHRHAAVDSRRHRAFRPQHTADGATRIIARSAATPPKLAP
jgi:RHH-type proline utilization regulon transcriptional repressor/proline dehydrogenase/delta 1-pyrroline-5-carboxylate dehydrogenase